MAARPEGNSSLMTSRWWTPLCLAAIAGWVAAILVGAYVWPGDESGGRYAAVAYGALFFGLLFGYSIIVTRRAQLRVRSELFDRLALTPVSPDALRASTRGMYRIGYVYFTLGIIVTGLGLGAIAAYGTAWERRLIYVAVGIVVAWCVYMVYALWKVTRVSDAVFAPLGLRVTSMPQYRVGLFHDGGSLEGALSYAGNRRGRDVSIVIGLGGALTAVAGPTANKVPTSSTQMAKLTGEKQQCWRNVSVALTDGDVIVTRTGRDCGRWFLHDLLLAESVAGPLPPPA